MKAVVASALNQFEVIDVDLADPRHGEVLVQIAATGVCHSDLSIINGTIPSPFPVVLGHEGAGVVAQVGTGVDRVAVGDKVILSFVPHCGECYHCKRAEPYLCIASPTDGTLLDGTTRVSRNGEPIYVMSFLGIMAEYAVVPAICAVPVPKETDLQTAALIGCGVTTGVGAVLRTAKVRPGSTVAVLGCGGVGLSVVQGARIAGATRIIAIDSKPQKLSLATKLGATDTLDAAEDISKAISAMTHRIGVDYAFEAIGLPGTIEASIKIVRRGGTAVLIGVGRKQDRFSVSTLILPLTAKTIRGCMYGSVNSKIDFERYLEFYQRGQLDLERLITRRYTIDQAPDAFADLEAGVNARGIIVYQ